MSDTPRTDELERTKLLRYRVPSPATGEALLHARELERELTAAIRFIKGLNATTAPGRVYRARCGKFLRRATKPKT